MNRVLIVVNNKKEISVLRGFPNDEKHAGLHELLEEVENEEKLDLPSGIYSIQLEIGHINSYDPTDEFEYLRITQISQSLTADDIVKIYGK